MVTRARASLWVASYSLAASVLMGCGGGSPLFHPAHVLSPGKVTAGAGVSGQIPVFRSKQVVEESGSFERLSVAPGAAPWVGSRIGVAGSNELGLAYTGRTIRLDFRHAFVFGNFALSLGAAANAVVARRITGEGDGSAVYGGGFDIPVLFGYKSRSDLYSIWLGPRGGLEFLSGRLPGPVGADNQPTLIDASGRHAFVGFTAGLRIGFRHLYGAVELNGLYHRAAGTVGKTSVELEGFSLAPSAALVLAF